MAKNNIPIKIIVAVGDSQCGKSTLLFKFAKDQFIEGYLPTLFENYAAEVESSQGVVQVSMYDTPGSDNFSHLRPLSYPNSDVLLLCFDLLNDDSYRSLFRKWIPEVKDYCPHIPFIIVGCKSDIKLEPIKRLEYIVAEQIPTTQSEVSQLLNHTGAFGYFTCSAKTDDNMLGVFSQAIEATFQRKRRCYRRLRSLSAVSLEPEPNMLFGSSSRRRAFTATSANRSLLHRDENVNCFTAFRSRKHVANEQNYLPGQQGSCTIL